MMRRIVYVLIAALAMTAIAATVARARAQAPAAQAGSRAERTAWYFYRVKWGFQDEFVALFAKNHLPVLKAQMKSGRITDVRTAHEPGETIPGISAMTIDPMKPIEDLLFRMN